MSAPSFRRSGQRSWLRRTRRRRDRSCEAPSTSPTTQGAMRGCRSRERDADLDLTDGLHRLSVRYAGYQTVIAISMAKAPTPRSTARSARARPSSRPFPVRTKFGRRPRGDERSRCGPFRACRSAWIVRHRRRSARGEPMRQGRLSSTDAEEPYRPDERALVLCRQHARGINDMNLRVTPAGAAVFGTESAGGTGTMLLPSEAELPARSDLLCTGRWGT